jgi:sugar/nucleoside kinase (ribokinase family)
MDAAIFGLIVADLLAEPMDLRDPPAPGGLRLINSIQLAPGGNVCNTGMAMARLGLSVAAAGMIGDDVLGRAVLERLNAQGVNTDAVVTTTAAQTSATIVAVEPGGERCFFHTAGVTPLLDAKLFRQSFPTFRQCAWLQVGYFGLLPSLVPELPELLREFRQVSPGTRIALDTVNPPAEMKQLIPILPQLDLFAPSRTEAESLTNRRDPLKMLAEFRAHMPQGIIGIKLDSEGCLLDDGRREAVTAPAYKVRVLDTTGAGDTWFAGLLVALRKDMPLDVAARFANRVAADCCTALGASAGVRSLEETLARI